MAKYHIITLTKFQKQRVKVSTFETNLNKVLLCSYCSAQRCVIPTWFLFYLKFIRLKSSVRRNAKYSSRRIVPQHLNNSYDSLLAGTTRSFNNILVEAFWLSFNKLCVCSLLLSKKKPREIAPSTYVFECLIKSVKKKNNFHCYARL